MERYLAPWLLLGLLTWAGACKPESPPAQKPPQEANATPSTTTSTTDDSGSGDYSEDYGGDYGEDKDSEDDFSSNLSGDCVAGDCPKKRIKIKAIDIQTESTVSSLKGETFSNNGWGFQGTSSDEGRQIGLRADSIPSDADAQEQDGVLVVLWTPENEGNGSIKITARDISRCIADNDDDEDMQADCEDMEVKSGMSKYEDSKSFSYRIVKDAATKEIEQQEKAAEAAKKQQCMQGMLGAATSLFGGGQPDLGKLAGTAVQCF